MKNKKNILSILSVFILSFIFMTDSVFAQEPIPKDTLSTQTVIINEYDALKKLESQDELSLKEKGLSTLEIQNVKNSISLMAENVKEKSKLPADELKLMGYNDKQINIIKNFKGTEAELRAASGEVIYTISINGYVHNSAKTSANLQVRWQWLSTPIQQFTDAIAVAWSKGFNSNGARTYANLYYKDNSNGTTKIIRTENATFTAGAGFQINFPFTDVANAGPYAKCLEGYAYTEIYNDSDIRTFEVITEYGHSYAFIVPSIAIKGAPSITFGIGTNTMGQAKREVRDGVVLPQN
ncbi:hypothetical protein [uncultured Clostridium sp.]|uniref:hypothetical protein n=1 Tax=uncultured Clostridium sp. TaxID=59620 RepID=UPI0028EC867C|nr:hypothetical protein [uncultured Clostridium sp.]